MMTGPQEIFVCVCITISSYTANLSHALYLKLCIIKRIGVNCFRFVPAEEEGGQPMTVDAEKLECRVVQGRIVPGGCRLMLKEIISTAAAEVDTRGPGGGAVV
jgi:hypothetical protein